MFRGMYILCGPLSPTNSFNLYSSGTLSRCRTAAFLPPPPPGKLRHMVSKGSQDPCVTKEVGPLCRVGGFLMGIMDLAGCYYGGNSHLQQTLMNSFLLW